MGSHVSITSTLDITKTLALSAYPHPNSPQQCGVRENSLHFPRGHSLEGGISGGEDSEGPGLGEEGDQAGELEGGDEGGEERVEDQEVQQGAAGAAVMRHSSGQ